MNTLGKETELILQGKMDVNAKDEQGKTPLELVNDGSKENLRR